MRKKGKNWNYFCFFLLLFCFGVLLPRSHDSRTIWNLYTLALAHTLAESHNKRESMKNGYNNSSDDDDDEEKITGIFSRANAIGKIAHEKRRRTTHASPRRELLLFLFFYVSWCSWISNGVLIAATRCCRLSCVCVAWVRFLLFLRKCFHLIFFVFVWFLLFLNCFQHFITQTASSEQKTKKLLRNDFTQWIEWQTLTHAPAVPGTQTNGIRTFRKKK